MVQQHIMGFDALAAYMTRLRAHDTNATPIPTPPEEVVYLLKDADDERINELAALLAPRLKLPPANIGRALERVASDIRMGQAKPRPPFLRDDPTTSESHQPAPAPAERIATPRPAGTPPAPRPLTERLADVDATQPTEAPRDGPIFEMETMTILGYLRMFDSACQHDRPLPRITPELATLIRNLTPTALAHVGLQIAYQDRPRWADLIVLRDFAVRTEPQPGPTPTTAADDHHLPPDARALLRQTLGREPAPAPME